MYFNRILIALGNQVKEELHRCTTRGISLALGTGKQYTITTLYTTKILINNEAD